MCSLGLFHTTAQVAEARHPFAEQIAGLSFSLTSPVCSLTSIVLLQQQANVLFTMEVVPVARGARNTEEQATAQLLYQDNRVLVCQYLLRSAGQY